MKLCTEKIVLRHKRLARYRAAAKARKNKKADRHKVKDRQKVLVDSLVAPKTINVSKPNGVELEEFLHTIEHKIFSLHKRCQLDFRGTETIHVAGAILLFAEIDRITSLSTLIKPITILEPKNKQAREVLKQIGIYQLTGDSSDVIPERDDVVFWKSTKGSTQSGDALGSLLECVAERANRDHIQKVELSGIWRGVSEAVANTVDHAYEKPRKERKLGLPDTKWWMFTQLRDNTFTAAVCDLGCGYSATVNLTIPESFISQWQRLLKGKNKDSIAVQTAMEYGRSGTHESNRGKGSRDALSVLRTHGTGTLHVISNTGWVKFTYENGREIDIKTGALGVDIRGTILWWNLPLNGE